VVSAQDGRVDVCMVYVCYLSFPLGNTSTALLIIKKHQPFPANMADKRKVKKSTYLAQRQ